MSDIDGGREAARGFHFQYVVSASRVLEMAYRNSRIGHVHVEQSGVANATVADDQAVDLSVHSVDGQILSVVQIKSVANPEGSTVSAGRILSIIESLARIPNAESYEYVTNAKLGPSGESLMALIIGGGRELETEMDRLQIKVPHVRAAIRRGRFIQVSDAVTLRREFRFRLRDIRLAQRVGTGVDSSELLSAFIIDKVTQAAAGLRGTEIDRETLRGWLSTKPAAIASALGDYDWGNIVGTWPAPSTVLREGVAVS
ncbi:hypothetical protein [Tsukamurella pseudospumae]|uniref:hypothetical protein n=1 Tax=Tsukamurella pseudospumae TaxID=239498 RepID=UPI000ACBD292|nr:hypothetical protein [Tsukamurella pseudospumae]